MKESKEDKQEREPPEETEETRRSERTRKPFVRYGYDEYVGTSTHGVYHVAYHVCEVGEPKTIQDAKSSEHATE